MSLPPLSLVSNDPLGFVDKITEFSVCLCLLSMIANFLLIGQFSLQNLDNNIGFVN